MITIDDLMDEIESLRTRNESQAEEIERLNDRLAYLETRFSQWENPSMDDFVNEDEYITVDGELLHESEIKFDHSGNPRRIND